MHTYCYLNYIINVCTFMNINVHASIYYANNRPIAIQTLLYSAVGMRQLTKNIAIQKLLYTAVDTSVTDSPHVEPYSRPTHLTKYAG